MKTMDNRIALDKDSVKHFVSDAYIKETADRFRKVKLQIAQHNQSKLEQKAASALMSSASVIPQDALGTENHWPKRNRAKNETPLIRATFFYMLSPISISQKQKQHASLDLCCFSIL